MSHLDKVARFNSDILPSAIESLKSKERYLETAINTLEKNEKSENGEKGKECVSISVEDLALRTYFAIKENVSSLKLLLVLHGKQIDNVESMLKFVSANFPQKHKRLRRRFKRYRSRLHAAKSATDQLKLALQTKYSLNELINLLSVLLNFSINAAALVQGV